MDLSDAAYITFIAKSEQKAKSYTFIAEPNEQYSIEIDLTSDKLSFENNNLALDLVQSFTEPAPLQLVARQYFASSSILDSLLMHINNDKEASLLQLDTLFDLKLISNDFYSLVTIDRTIFYDALTVKAVELSSKSVEELSQTSKNYYQSVQNSLYIEGAARSQWWFEYAEMAIDSKIMSQFSMDSLMKIYNAKKLTALRVKVAAEIFDSKEVGEAMSYYIIYSAAIQMGFEKTLINDYKQFKINYPNSKYLKYLKPYIQQVEDYHRKISGDFPSEVLFLENYSSVNTLDELLSHFRGKRIYIDIWASWCGPCKKQFQYKEKLHDFLTQKDVELLYISIDEDHYIQNWEECIKYYELFGTHVRANEQLNEEIHELYGGIITIPKYIIVDENGKIVNKDAPEPSKIELLEEF